jgi:hypothetical protein
MRECVERLESIPPEYSGHRDGFSSTQCAYLDALQDGDECIHIRRSLDQSYYWSLPQTKDRDEDQVVTRYYNKFPTPGMNPPDLAPLLMVDQLWLWVMDEGRPHSKSIAHVS